MIKSTKRSLLSYSGRSSGETVGDLQDKLNSKKLPDHVRD